MKTKFLTLMLALLLCTLPLFSCEAAPTAASLYESSMTALEEAKGMEAKMSVLSTQTYDGETMSMGMEYTVKVNENDLEMNLEMDISEEKIEMNTIYVDGYLYADAMGQKFKSECSLDTLNELYSDVGINITNISDLMTQDVPVLSAEDLANVELKTESDGSFSFVATLDLDDVKEMSMLREVIDESSITVSNLSAIFTFTKDKVLSSCETKFDIATDDGESGSFSFKIDYINLTTPPTIEAPANAEDYVDMDFGGMFG